MQIAGVGVESSCLTGQRLDHVRMAVPDMTHVVHTVDVRPSVRVDQPSTCSSHDGEFASVAGAERRAEEIAATAEQLVR